MADIFDYIIVGAGSAGCLLANRLSRDPSKRVLLLEAGSKDNYHWIHIPVGYLYCIGNPRTDWLYRTEAEPGLNGRSLIYPRGKTLGGCSSINGMIYMRGQARDYDQWAALTGDASWSWQSVLPHFKAHEDHYRLDGGNDPQTGGNSRFSDLHGHGGEWRVEKQRLRWDILEAFAGAAVEAGVPRSEDFNTGDNEGVGYFDVNQRSGWRWNTSKAFLRPVLARPNLVVWTQAQAERLVFDTDDDGGLRCTGVRLTRAGTAIEVRARAEVILSAGAIGSPQILQLSGVGPADALQSCGISPVLDLPGVGANLQDPLQIRTVFKVTGAKTLNTLAGSLFGKMAIGLEYALMRTGPMSMSPSQLGAFTRSDESQPFANLEYHVQPLSLDAFGQPLHATPAFTVSVCNLNPTSRGHVMIRSPRAQDAPAIAPNYLATAEDRKIAADSIRPVGSNVPARTLPVPTSTPMRKRPSFAIAVPVWSVILLVLVSYCLSARSEIDAVGQDHEVTDRHVARARQHEEHGFGHFLRLHQASIGERLVHLCLRPVVEKRGDHRSGQDRADAHAVLGDLATRRMHEGLNREFGGRVDRLPNDRNDTGNRTGEEDVARLLRDHVRQDGMNGAERRIDVEVQHPVPCIRIPVRNRAADIGAGIGVEDVETTGGLQDGVQHSGNIRWFQEVDHDRIGAFADFVAKLLQLFAGAVDEDDLCTGGMKRAGAFEPDPRCGSRDGRDFSFHGLGHEQFSECYSVRRGRGSLVIDGQASRRSRRSRERHP